jgi:hypothetical protein
MPRRVPAATESTVADLYQKRDLTLYEIAARFGLTREGVYKIAKRNGCPQRNPWGQPRRRDREADEARMLAKAEAKMAAERATLRRRCEGCGAITGEPTCPNGHRMPS